MKKILATDADAREKELITMGLALDRPRPALRLMVVR